MGTNAEVFALAGRYLHSGDAAQAEGLFRQILQNEPGHIDAHCNLGVACARQGKLEEAVASYQAALRLRPDFAEAHFNLANVLRRKGDFDGAVAGYTAALRWLPNHAGLYYNLGLALVAQHRLDEAIASFQQSLRLLPDNPEAYNGLGNALRERGRLEEALACFQRFLQLKPQEAKGLNNLGITLATMGKGEEAIRALREVVRVHPEYPDAQCNLGITLAEKGYLDEAIAHSLEAARLRPELFSAHITLGLAYAGQGKLQEALASWRHAFQLKPDFAGVHCNILYALNFDPQIDSATLFAAHRQWQIRHGQVPRLRPGPDLDLNPDRRLRVGYVSPDFRRHPITWFVLPVLSNHDPSQVETVCYAEVQVPDAGTAQCRAAAKEWRSICNIADPAVADMIRRDRIDILVDLAGHTNNTRLRVFAYKPAPVQVTYLGYPFTTGLTTVDYRLTDAVTDPPGEPPWYTEELVRLPGGFCCFVAPEYAPAITPLPALKNGHVTFGSVHNLAKLNVGVLDLWGSILRAVPTARILLYRNTLNGTAMDRFRREFIDRGVSEERVVLRHAARPGHGYLDIYEEIDIFLDAFPWSGHTTACEALWMGVPVVTLRGTRHAGRMAASILTQVGLTDWVTETQEQYLARAVQAAQDVPGLAALRPELRQRVKASPLGDGKTFTRGLEEAYRWMWRQFCTKQAKMVTVSKTDG